MSLAARALPAIPPTAGTRYFARTRLGLPARLVTFAGTSDCTLVDLSRGGARLRVRDGPRIGAMVLVERLPISLIGTVRWAVPFELGFAFPAPLPLGQLVALRYYAEDEAERRRHALSAHARGWVARVF